VESETRDVAGVIAPPPFIYGGALLAGLLLQRLVPLRLLPGKAGRIVGMVLIGSGLLVGVPAFRAMHRAGTEVDPREETTALVTSGPFRYTRNPLYLTQTLIYAGLAAFANALWPILFLPGVLVAITKGVIEREERYLERKFGDEYRQYKVRVRRWI
jgi:protein-S-isoprenylcysteine O-methyltransferase Ste14